MGMFKDLGDTMGNAQKMQEQAAAMQAGGAVPGVSGTEMATMQKLQHLNAVGVEKPATITSIAPTGNVDPGGGKEYAIGVKVEGDAPYDATFTQFMHEATMGSWATDGAEVNVKVDPADPNSMILWGGRS
jgi:hypothetical protein